MSGLYVGWLIFIIMSAPIFYRSFAKGLHIIDKTSHWVMWWSWFIGLIIMFHQTFNVFF